MSNIGEIKKELREKSSPERAMVSLRFFKTGEGQYGEGDKFLGVNTPEQRKITKKYHSKTPIEQALKLLQSKFHEERMVALLILMMKYKTASKKFEKNRLQNDWREMQKIFSAYLANTKFINNWDLVDVTCRDIVGAYLFEYARRESGKNRKILYKLARSKNLWKKRIAIVSTFYFIAKNDLADTFKIAKMLLSDKHDLIHKAVGWALREAGKKDKPRLVKFLKKNISQMPRTTLRYAIEKFPEEERKKILS